MSRDTITLAWSYSDDRAIPSEFAPHDAEPKGMVPKAGPCRSKLAGEHLRYQRSRYDHKQMEDICIMSTSIMLS